MPTQPLSAPIFAGREGRQPDPKGPAPIAVAFAAFAAIVLSASTQHLAASAPSSEPVSVSPAPPMGALAQAAADRLTVLPRNVDTLVATLARRYRVSASATRQMVDAAYVEAGRNGLDPLLIIAVIAVESRFNPIAQSDGGALGLMQVIPRFHADKFSVADSDSMFDPRVNIQVGAAVLRDYIRRGGTEIAGLQLYNGALDDETTAYAHKVLAEKQRLQSMIRRGV